MAYMSQERKAALAPAIKAVLKKYDLKGSISVDNHSTLVVTIKSGPIDFIGNMLAVAATRPGRYNNDTPTYMQVNPYWIADHHTGSARDCLLALKAAMQGPDWFDRSDIRTDYFDISWYININIGKWNKPYILTVG